MSDAKRMPLTWHDIDKQGLQFAGNTAGLVHVGNLYRRYPGMNVSIIDRLKYFTFEAGTVGQQSSVFKVDYGSVVLDARQGMFKDLPPEDYKREGIKDKMQSMLLERIDAGRGMSTYYQTKWQGGGRNLNQMVFGTSDVQTRTEIMAGLAGIPPQRYKMPDDVSLAEVHQFVLAHELQHARNASTYKLDDDFYDPTKTSKAEKFGCFERLKARFEGDNPIIRAKTRNTELSKDLYAGYVDETICDTAAVLHHLKKGGSFSMVRTLADTRAAGFVMKGTSTSSFKYGMHSVLDKLAANEDAVQKLVDETPEEQLDQVAVYFTANLGWSRTQFFKNAAAARMATHAFLCKSEGPEAEQSLENAKADVLKMTEEYSARKKDRQVIMPTDEGIQKHADRTAAAVKGLLRDAPERATDHLVEVQAVLAYNQTRRPEFMGPEGQKHLLAMRERFVANERRLSAHEEKVMNVLRSRADHMAKIEPDPRLQPIADKEPPKAPETLQVNGHENGKQNDQENDYSRS